MAHDILHADELSAPAGVFVQATRVEASGHFIYVSGLTSRNRDGSVFGAGDIRAQTAHILDNLKIILARGNATLDDVVRVVVYITDMEDFAAIHEVRAKYFARARPASTMVEVSRLVHPDMKIEIEATAHVT
ncbi:MAG: Endoribonuclease [Rhodospirillales bacterium]|jgi:reactive intermediate/imine deaminase|nr:Endoribonuclease [Rhodospirillales bacterium]